MALKLITIGVVALALTATSCKNPDDRFARATSAFVAP